MDAINKKPTEPIRIQNKSVTVGF